MKSNLKGFFYLLISLQCILKHKSSVNYQGKKNKTYTTCPHLKIMAQAENLRSSFLHFCLCMDYTRDTAQCIDEWALEGLVGVFFKLKKKSQANCLPAPAPFLTHIQYNPVQHMRAVLIFSSHSRPASKLMYFLKCWTALLILIMKFISPNDLIFVHFNELNNTLTTLEVIHITFP